MTEAAARGIIVHDAIDVARARRAAANVNSSLRLVSAPGASRSLGPDVFTAMTDTAGTVAILDCGDDAGEVMRAFRMGCRHVYFRGATDVAAKLSDIAAASGGVLVDRLPTTIDLADPDVTDDALEDWLRKPKDGSVEPL